MDVCRYPIRVNEYLPIAGMTAVGEDKVESVQTKIPTRR